MAKIVAGVAMVAGAVALAVVDPAATPYAIKLGMMGASLTIGGIADELRGGPTNAFSTKQPAASRQVVYGQMRVSGTIVFESTTGHQLNQVIVWASHLCQSIDKVYIDGKEVHFAGGATSGNADGSTYIDPAGNHYSFPSGGKLYVEHALGSTAGHWFASLAGNDPKWDATNTLNGICASYIKTTADSNVYSGPPGVKVALHGKSDIYDPRDGQHKWTDNAALVIADFLCNSEYGVGCDYLSEIDEPQLIAAANICDEQVALAQGGTESRYTVNGFFEYSSTPGDILNSLLMSCEGRISYSGGRWKIFPAAWYGTTIAFTQDDFAGPVKWIPKRKYRELCNAVRATYISPVFPYAVIGANRNFPETGIFSGEYQPTDAPEYAQDPAHGYASDLSLTADGNKLYTDRRYQFVTSVATVQRLMKIFLMRNRQQGSGALQMQLSAYQTQAQDVISVDFPTLNWLGKNLEVQQFHFLPKLDNGNGEAPSLMCELDVVETDPSVYTWSTSEERGIQDTNSPTLFDNFQVGAPTALLLESGLDSAIVNTDGVVLPRIHVSWVEPDDPFVTTGGHIVVLIQKVGDVGWTTAAVVDGTTTDYFIPGVICNQQYNVEVYSKRATGATSVTVSAGPHTVSQTTSNFTSGTLNNGSISPGQLAVIPYTTSQTFVTFSWAAQNLLRGDGTYLTVAAGSKTFSGLLASHTYYTYWYVDIATGTLKFTNPDPPSTSPSSLLLAQCFLDGRYGIGTVVVTTAATGGTGGGGTGGGGDVCPEAAELVDIRDKGSIPAGEVEPGDYIKGRCLATGQEVYRRVSQVRKVSNTAWRLIQEHRVSPCEPVYYQDKWTPAYLVPIAKFDVFHGTKVQISVDSDEYDEQNYLLTAGEQLLIHNFNTPVLPC